MPRKITDVEVSLFKHATFMTGGGDDMIERYLNMVEESSGEQIVWWHPPHNSRVEILTNGNVNNILKIMFSE